jgi:Flp pilus assembly protein TadG
MTISLASLIGRSLLAPLQRLWRDETGVTAIEFGILAPPFFAMIGVILETSVMFLSSQVLDSAVHDASRQIRTGQAQHQKYTLAQFEDLICDRLFGLFSDCHALQVNVKPVNKFIDAVVTAPVDPNCVKDCPWLIDETFDPGTRSNTVLVQVYYKWPVVLNLPSLMPNKMEDGTVLMGSVDVFRNEPF